MSESCSMPNMSASKEVRRCVEQYCARERHPDLAAVKVHGPFMYSDLWNWAAANLPGCYAIYGDDGCLRYIGMSVTNVGNRIGSHFQRFYTAVRVLGARTASDLC